MNRKTNFVGVTVLHHIYVNIIYCFDYIIKKNNIRI